MAIPVDARRALNVRLEGCRRERWPESLGLTVRYNGQYAYVGRDGADGQPDRLFRLSWTGAPDAWGFAVWDASDKRYVEAPAVANGDARVTPEEALDRTWAPVVDETSAPTPEETLDHVSAPVVDDIIAPPPDEPLDHVSAPVVDETSAPTPEETLDHVSAPVVDDTVAPTLDEPLDHVSAPVVDDTVAPTLDEPLDQTASADDGSDGTSAPLPSPHPRAKLRWHRARTFDGSTAATVHGPVGGRPEPHALRPYLRAIRAHRLFVALFMLAALAGSIAILQLRSPTYTASAKLLVTPVDRGEAAVLGLPLIQELGDPTRTIETAASIVQTQAIAAAAAEVMGAPWTAERVLDAVVVAPLGQTNVLAVKATDDSAADAAKLADAYANAVIQVRTAQLQERIDRAIGEIEADLAAPSLPAPSVDVLQQRLSDLRLMRVGGDPTIAVSESASIPQSETGPPSVLIVLIALLAAAVLAPGAALAVELLGPRRLMAEDDLAAVLPLPRLARVPRVRPPPTPGAVDQRVRTSYRRLGVRLALSEPHPRTVIFTSPSRADGRSTSALHLADALAEDGSRVLLIDLDTAKPDLSVAAIGETDASSADESDRAAGDRLTRTSLGPSLLVLSPRADDHWAGNVIDVVWQTLENDVDKSDYVVIDAPPLDEMSDALRLVASIDAVILVARLGHTTRASVETARELLAATGVPATGFVVIGSPLPGV